MFLKFHGRPLVLHFPHWICPHPFCLSFPQPIDICFLSSLFKDVFIGCLLHVLIPCKYSCNSATHPMGTYLLNLWIVRFYWVLRFFIFYVALPSNFRFVHHENPVLVEVYENMWFSMSKNYIEGRWRGILVKDWFCFKSSPNYAVLKFNQDDWDHKMVKIPITIECANLCGKPFFDKSSGKTVD